MSRRLLSPAELEERLRAIGAERYHDRHPFHRLLHDGQLSRGQVQAWALNRYYYQSRIPIKDAYLMTRLPTAALRRAWRHRLVDHDGDAAGRGTAWMASRAARASAARSTGAAVAAKRSP